MVSGWHLLVQRREPRRGYSVPQIDGFVTLGRCFTPVSMWSGYNVRFEHVARDTRPFWAGPGNQRRPVHLDDASTTASLIVDHSHLLDGITTSGSPYSAVSSRFNRLRTSHPVGDDAVSRTTSAVGLAGTYQISPGAPTSICSYRKTVGGCLLPPIPRPGKVGFGRTDRTKPVQAERPSEILCVSGVRLGLYLPVKVG